MTDWLVVAMVVVAVAAIFTAFVIGAGQWRTRLGLRRLHGDVERLTDRLRTPEERAAVAEERAVVEDQQRRVHGRFED